MEKPENVIQAGDGFFYTRVGELMVMTCEDCWQSIPNYIDFPRGLVSPESDGDKGGNFAKTRKTAIEGKDAVEHLQKAVCLPCYLEAFKRVSPDAELPELSPLQRPEAFAVPPVPESETIFVDEPKP